MSLQICLSSVASFCDNILSSEASLAFIRCLWMLSEGSRVVLGVPLQPIWSRFVVSVLSVSLQSSFQAVQELQATWFPVWWGYTSRSFLLPHLQPHATPPPWGPQDQMVAVVVALG